ncbi:MAG TPA: tetratricopeptide repeat protein [Alphaproteobacteria bacterium]|nr:tetratricopeptide repeat protein [Alphaproteobacteria bacterium]
MKSIIVAVLILFVLALSVSAPARAGWDEAMAAFERGDYAAALEEFRGLAEAGNPDGQIGLGVMYASGYGVAQDFVQAAHWFRLAAERGVASAQYRLGDLYYRGLGVAEDFSEAALWVDRAARQGYVDAQRLFAIMHALGEGVPLDMAQSYAWFAQAAAQADGESAEGVYLVAESMSAAEIAAAVSIAEAWLAEHGYELGMVGVPALDVLAPLGASSNPVRADGPPGERQYLMRLRCPEGDAPAFGRLGSVGEGPYGRIMDVYDVQCGGDGSAEVYMDMYHQNHNEQRPLPGFTILSHQAPGE